MIKLNHLRITTNHSSIEFADVFVKLTKTDITISDVNEDEIDTLEKMQQNPRKTISFINLNEIKYINVDDKRIYSRFFYVKPS